MKNTVAIIGSHPATRGDFDWERTDADVWGFNEALSADWFERADGIFQMHKPVIWRSKTNRNDPEHYGWLKSGDTPVIFMQDEYSDVPKSERYPLEDVLDLAPGIGYFTSSVAYAIALAILKGYKRIEVYGVEMETQSEYGHQRVGVAFWTGVAAGRGIQIDFHSPSFFSAPLYGYDGDVEIPLELYENGMAQMEKHVKGSGDAYKKVHGIIKDLLDRWIESYKTDLSELDQMVLALRENALTFGKVDGQYQTYKMYLDKCNKMIEETGNYLIVRQEFEGNGAGAKKEIPAARERMLVIADELGKRRKALNTNDNKSRREVLVNEFMENLKRFTDSITVIGYMAGAIDANAIVIQRYDQMLRDAGVDKEQAVEILEEIAE